MTICYHCKPCQQKRVRNMCHNTISLQKTLYFIFSKFCPQYFGSFAHRSKKDQKEGGHTGTFFFFLPLLSAVRFQYCGLKVNPTKRRKIFLNFPNSLIWKNLPPGNDMSARLAQSTFTRKYRFAIFEREKKYF